VHAVPAGPWALQVPLLLPLLVCGIDGTIGAFAYAQASEVTPYLKVLAAYLAATVTASWMLFPYVWEG